MLLSDKNITVISSEPFWRQGAGCWTRLQTVVKYLSQRAHLDIICLGTASQNDLSILTQLEIPFTFTSADNHITHTHPDTLSQLENILRQNNPTDIYLIDKAENSYVLDALPQKSIKIMYADDLVHQRNNSMKHFGITDNFVISSRQERALFNRYNAIICIQRDEYNTARLWARTYTCLYVPHPITTNPLPLAVHPTRIGMVASAWHANINGLDFFIKNVWPQLSTQCSLHIYGYVADAFSRNQIPGIYLHGFQQNITDCYRHIDIVINPVFYGAGLKIKTVEAMAYGLPLVTTHEGASGLTHLSGKAFLVANNPEQFIYHINALMNDSEQRHQLSERALNYITEHMNEERCFEPLITYLQNC